MGDIGRLPPVEQPASEPLQDAVADENEVVDARRTGAGPILLLGALYAVAVALYFVLARQSPIPLVQPDEIIYGTLAQSVADGDGLTIRGGESGLRSALYVYLIAPAWKFASGSDAFEISQLIGAALLCLTVFPVWLLARRYVGPWIALVPAALMVSGTWMVTAAGMLTENVGLPLSAAALAATVIAISTPGSRWGWGALGLALLATFARAQLAVLIPVILTAVAIDCARYGQAWRERLAQHRVLLSATAALILVGALAVAVASDGVLGLYKDIDAGPSGDALAGALKDQLTGLLTMAAVLPIVIVAAAGARGESWRDERLGPLLAVTAATVLLFVGQSAWALTGFVADARVPWHIQRYVEYALPLLLVTMTVVITWRRVAVRELAIAGTAATLFLLATPGVRNAGEERGLFGLQERVNSVLGTSAGQSVALVSALLVAVALIAALRLRDRPVAALGAVSLSMLAIFAVQGQVIWHFQDDTSSSWRAGFPKSLSWVDEATSGPVARMLVIGNAPRSEMTQLFNRDIDRVYVPNTPLLGRPLIGRQCPWTYDDQGAVTWGPACGAPPTQLLLDDDFAKVSFHGQDIVSAQPGIGRIIGVQGAHPRIESVLRIPCGPLLPSYVQGGHSERLPAKRACSNELSGAFWLDGPGELVLRFRGGSQDTNVSFDVDKPDPIPRRVVTTLREPIPDGRLFFRATLGWTGPGPEYPALMGAEIVEKNGKTTDLLY